MARENPYRPFTPDPEQMALFPEQSGNAINGLGESEQRRPTPVYWHDPDRLAHGALQRWFYGHNSGGKGLAEARRVRQAIIDREVPPPAGSPAEHSPADWTQALLTFAETVDCELVGVAKMQPDWVFEGYEVRERMIVMIGVAHDYDEISRAPEPEAGVEVVRQYGRGLAAAKDIAAWFTSQGWAAKPHGGPMAGPMTLIPPAIACGFGELGKHGSIINREHGSSFRLACVLTDAPLEPTPAESYAVDDFCMNCHICEDACPPDAILPEKVTVRGETKWYVDFDKCLPFFNETAGCAICIAVCPWSRPGIGMSLAEKMIRRRARLTADDYASP